MKGPTRAYQGLGRRPVLSWLALGAALSSSALGAADFETETHDGIEFVAIPAGSFWMGTTDEERQALISDKVWTRFNESERPAHLVTISKPFLIAKFETTQKQWKALMGANPSAFKGDDRPVESVSWEDVQQFIRKLSERSKTTYRLPTEAEWEYCCRAGSTNQFGLGRTSEALSDRQMPCYAWFRGNAENQSHPVGQKDPNAWGLQDMHGNVWEWCQDWFANDFYSHSVPVDPVNTQRAAERVFRGGSWFLDWTSLRVANRSGNLPEFRSQYVGFRLVRNLAEPPGSAHTTTAVK